MNKVKLAIGDLSIPDKIQLATTIVTSMTGNASFAEPNPPLASIETQTATLSTATAKADEARHAAQIATIAQDDAEDKLDDMLTQLSSYVENTSGGDEALILSTGMSVRDKATAAEIPATPGPVAATTGDDPGEIDLSWPRGKRAKAYVVQHATQSDAADADWKFATTTTKSQCTLTGLTSGSRYWFRVAATGTAGQSAWSSPASARVS